MAQVIRIEPRKTPNPVALDQEQQAGDKVLLARSAWRKGNKDEAKELLKQVFAATPGDRGAIELLGDIYLEEGETEKAAKLFERAVSMFPGVQLFEERLAECQLDLAEMENDKLTRELLLTGGDQGKKFELDPSKAVGLSLLLVGSGQFYNDEVEKGAFFLGGGLVTCIGWFWPLMSALSGLDRSNRLNFEMALNSMTGFIGTLFWIMLVLWLGIYTLGAVDAGMTASKLNKERRRGLGL